MLFIAFPDGKECWWGRPARPGPWAERGLRGWGPAAGHPGRLGPSRLAPAPARCQRGREAGKRQGALDREPALPDCSSGLGQTTLPLSVPFPRLSNETVGPCLPPKGVTSWEALERTRQRVRPWDGGRKGPGPGKRQANAVGRLPSWWKDRQEEGGVFLGAGTLSPSGHFILTLSPGRLSNRHGYQWGKGGWQN